MANTERSKEMLYSKYLAYYIQHGYQVAYNGEQFYRALPQWGLVDAVGGAGAPTFQVGGNGHRVVPHAKQDVGLELNRGDGRAVVEVVGAQRDVVRLVTPGTIQMGERNVVAAREALHRHRVRLLEIAEGMVVFNEQVRFPVRPMVGVIGTAPATEPAAPRKAPATANSSKSCGKRVTETRPITGSAPTKGRFLRRTVAGESSTRSVESIGHDINWGAARPRPECASTLGAPVAAAGMVCTEEIAMRKTMPMVFAIFLCIVSLPIELSKGQMPANKSRKMFAPESGSGGK